jgi:hypothetical protein
MHIFILAAAVIIIGFFAIKAARYGALGINEIKTFAVIMTAFAGYLIYLVAAVLV